MSQFYLDVEKLMKREGCNLTHLAEKVGINKGNLSKIANGRPVNIKTINKVAQALNIENANEILTLKKVKR